MSENTQTGITMNQAEDLITSILRRNNIPLRAPSSGATPDVPAPEDIDTGNRKRIFKGIKQVTYEEYTNLTEEERKQYMFFVRESADAAFGFVGIGNLKYTMVPEDIRGIDCGYFDCIDYSKHYFTIEVTEPGELGFERKDGTIFYSLDDGGTWTEFVDPIQIDNAQTKIIFKGNNADMQGERGIGTFTSDDNLKFNVSGNIMSLMFGDNFVGQLDIPVAHAFRSLFFSCMGLVDAGNLSLPATGLTENCYSMLFMEAINLVKPPKLPAMVMADECYSHLFDNCWSLETAPKFPATTLASNCYYSTFANCRGLINAPEILPATQLVYYCYDSMFLNCPSLEVGPYLPATTVAEGAYALMFDSCSSLSSIRCAANAGVTSNNCYSFLARTLGGTFLVDSEEARIAWMNSGCVPGNWEIQVSN